MAAIFYVLGLVSIVLGGGWVAYAIITPPAQTGYDPSVVQLGRLLALSPGVGLIAGGLLLLAIGGVLSRLDRIAENTSKGAGHPRPGSGPAFD